MRHLLTYALCAAIVFLPACNLLTPQQRAAGLQAIESAYDRGELTPTQREQAINALEGRHVDWEAILITGGSIITSILLGVPIAVARTNRIRDARHRVEDAAAAAGTAKP